MKFEREIPIGLDARRKKPQRGAESAPPPPMGLGLKMFFLMQWNWKMQSFKITESVHLKHRDSFGKEKLKKLNLFYIW